jgi:glycosyltransferase involved in cell wall biosynthesis
MNASYDFHLVVGPEIHQNDFENNPSLTIHICPYLIRAISPWHDFLALLWLAKLIRRERYDVIHTHETKASLLTRLAARIARVGPVIYGLHGVSFNDPLSSWRRQFYVWVEKFTIGAADFIVSVSRDAIQQYHERGIGREIPSEIIYSGVDLREFDPTLGLEEATALRRSVGADDDDVLLINVGRFSRAKDQRSTIDAFARVLSKKPSALLLLVGEGGERSLCEQQARSLKVDHRVRFLGFRNDIPQLMEIADIHVLTSLREGLPRVAVEASLAKVPTVAFEVDGVHEIVHDGESGYITPSGDVEMLTERIVDLVVSVDLRRRMGQRAFEHATAHWDHHMMLRQLDSVYTQVLEKERDNR